MKATVGWGDDGLQAALARGDVPVIVDVLRFSSTVTTAVANGFTVIPAPTAEEARRLTDETGAERRSLSPLDYVDPRDPGEVVLASPNGAALASSIPRDVDGYFACFLNARAAGRRLDAIAHGRGAGIALVAAGEVAEGQEADLRTRRFAIEDHLGCGAILDSLSMDLDDAAGACLEDWRTSKHRLAKLIAESPSGAYLASHSRAADLVHCLQQSIYDALPVIRAGRIAAWRGGD